MRSTSEDSLPSLVDRFMITLYNKLIQVIAIRQSIFLHHAGVEVFAPAFGRMETYAANSDNIEEANHSCNQTPKSNKSPFPCQERLELVMTGRPVLKAV